MVSHVNPHTVQYKVIQLLHPDKRETPNSLSLLCTLSSSILKWHTVQFKAKMVSHCKNRKLRKMIRLACFYSSTFFFFKFSLQIRRRQPKHIELIDCMTQVWCKILQHAYCSQLSFSGLHSHPCRGSHYLCCAPLHSLLFQRLREKAKASVLTCYRESTETDYKRPTHWRT